MNLRLMAFLMLFSSTTLAAQRNYCSSIFVGRPHEGTIVDFSSFQKLAKLNKDLHNVKFRGHFDNFHVLQTIFPNAQVNLNSDSTGVIQGDIMVRIVSGNLKLFQIINNEEVEFGAVSNDDNIELQSNEISYEAGDFQTHLISYDLTNEDKGFFVITLGTQNLLQAEVRAGDGNTYVVFFAYGLPDPIGSLP